MQHSLNHQVNHV